MTALHSEPVRRPCHGKLKPGEYKRVPKPIQYPPVAYYFACRKCGYIESVRTKFLNDKDGLPVTERGGKLIKLAAVECTKCGHRFAIEGGKYVDA